MFKSSTQQVPEAPAVPRHVAIIMDGNGRWAKKRFLPRFEGHRRGVETVREIILACLDQGVEYLTLFAFSSENWRRPEEEVSVLMKLFMMVLQKEVKKLQEKNVRLKLVGDMQAFGPEINKLITESEALTRNNTALTLSICANYGGRWDIVQATHRLLAEKPQLAATFSEKDLAPYLAMSHAPEPDLFIRTGGEQRISNFLLWQLAYSEFYFTDVLWPDFDGAELARAIESYQQRERRFGRTSEQLKSSESAAAETGK
ncbi:MAG: polyprenyl diphosphate synthase [Burkholderiales bacterium]